MIIQVVCNGYQVTLDSFKKKYRYLKNRSKPMQPVLKTSTSYICCLLSTSRALLTHNCNGNLFGVGPIDPVLFNSQVLGE